MQQHRQPATATAEAAVESAGDILKKLMDKPVSQRMAGVKDYLRKSGPEVLQNLLPDRLKGEAHRLCERAYLYIQSRDELAQCTPISLIRCVLQAAELGFSLDGKMCHAVKYSTRRKEGGRDIWEDVAQLQIDYKGQVAAARRIGLILDAWARIVMPEDFFTFDEHDGKVTYTYKPALDGDRSGNVCERMRGVFAVAILPNGPPRVEYMSREDIMHIRNKSKSWTGKNGPSGPWKTDDGEMTKKSALHRILKTFQDEPGMGLLLAVDEEDYKDAPDGSALTHVIREKPERRRIEDVATAATTTTSDPADTEQEQPEQEHDQDHDAPADELTTKIPWYVDFRKALKAANNKDDLNKVAALWLKKVQEGDPLEEDMMAEVEARKKEVLL